jgi:hypothetical protein
MQERQGMVPGRAGDEAPGDSLRRQGQHLRPSEACHAYNPRKKAGDTRERLLQTLCVAPRALNEPVTCANIEHISSAWHACNAKRVRKEARTYLLILEFQIGLALAQVRQPLGVKQACLVNRWIDPGAG